MRIRNAIAALTVSVALMGTAACGPQIVDCDDDNVVCTDDDGGSRNFGGDDDDDGEFDD